MLLNKLIRVHAKCSAILDMIQTANNRVNAAKADLHLYDNVHPLHTIRLFTTRTKLIDLIDHNRELKSRLEAYYATIATELLELQMPLLSHAA